MRGVIITLCVSIFLCSCVVYDDPIIYHRNYDVGYNDKLRIEGYYTKIDTLGNYGGGLYFFYQNGTVKWRSTSASLEELKDELGMYPNRWKTANYQIRGDTINIEFWIGDGANWLKKHREVNSFFIAENEIIGFHNGENNNKT
jgi:hypothetical protein